MRVPCVRDFKVIMGKDNRPRPIHGLPMDDAQMKASVAAQQAETAKLAARAKPVAGMMLNPTAGVMLVHGKGPLDIEQTVVAVPLPVLFDVVGRLMTDLVAPTFQNVKVEIDGNGVRKS